MSANTQTTEEIGVYIEGKQVGWLSRRDESQISFRYDPSWLKKGFAISISLPLTDNLAPTAAHNFFANLLPEGDFRRKIETQFRVSIDNDFSLLAAIGGDCAGALTVGVREDRSKWSYKKLDRKAIEELVKTEGQSGFSIPDAVRLSLAGAQGKLPVAYFEGSLAIPLNSAPSSHIIKFNRYSGVYPKLIENEYLCNRIAAAVGLDVPKSQLLATASARILLVERYDRQREQNGSYRRLHQEDFCQALGFSYAVKYEKEGGPSLALCAQLLRKISLLDLNKFIDWLIFNFLIGNSDAHGKNLSLLYSPAKAIARLAPFYDLICTRAYPAVDRGMAMKIGGESDPDLIKEKHLIALAQELDISFPFFKRRYVDMGNRIEKAIDTVIETLTAEGIDPRVTLQHALISLQKHFQKLRKIL